MAAHPNQEVQDEYTFDNDGRVLEHDTKTADTQTLPANYRTSILYVAAWNGLKVPQEWKFDEAEYKITTPDPNTTHNGEPDGEPAATEAGQDAVSINLAPGPDDQIESFTMEFDYSFNRDQGGDHGYVHAIKDGELLTRLGFVGNSGVKFSGFEAAILDIDAMVDMAGGIEKFAFDPQHGYGIAENDDDVTIPTGEQDANDQDILYEPRRLSRLLTGIKYASEQYETPNDSIEMRDYDIADPNADGDNNDGNPDWEKYYNTLANNKSRSQELGNHMRIEATRQSGGLVVVEIYVNDNQTPSYKHTDVQADGLQQVFVQAHWGSGVVFGNMTIEKEYGTASQ